MTGNLKTVERPFTYADVTSQAKRTLARFKGDRQKAVRYASNMCDRWESYKWEQVMGYLQNREDLNRGRS